jgi:hypothetical protein
VFTDHKPLTYALRRQAEPWTARQQRQLSFIAEFTSDLQHVARESNVTESWFLYVGGGGGGRSEFGRDRLCCLSSGTK